MARPGLSLLLPLAALPLALAWPGAPAQAEMLAFASPAQAAAGGDRVRVQADLARKVDIWHGSSDCRSRRRAHAALMPALSQWLGARLTERPTKRLAQWGYHSGDVWNEDRRVDGKPQCMGGFRKLIAYADFR